METLHDALQNLLEKPTDGCVVNRWLELQNETTRELFEKLKEKRGVNLTELYKKLQAAEPLSFKYTSFRYHMRGECSCQ